jgi:diadenylate cyclase
VEVAVEFLVIWIVVYAIVRFVQGTRAAGALKGLLVIVIVSAILSRVLGGSGAFQRLGLLYDRFLALIAIGLVVIFQPELRRALVRLGETPFLRGTPKDIQFIVRELSLACTYLAKAKFGAIIVLERQIGTAGLVEGGTVLNAELSARLLQTIFFPGSALHDLAVIVKGRTVHAAGVQLPLAEADDMPEATLGSRHRAAVGLTKECDALVIVVSEESGTVRVAERGKLSERMHPDDLEAELTARLTSAPVKVKAAPEPGEAGGAA